MPGRSSKLCARALPLGLILAAGVWVAPGPLVGQGAEREIRLGEAVRIALDQGAEARIAAARREAAEAGAREAGSALYPSVRLETGAMRSSDPVAAFGTRLRQGRFTADDFAVDRLNDPDPLDDWTSGVRVAWSGLDPAIWALRDASGREADAARHAEARAHEAIVFETTRAFYGAIRAEARLASADAAVDAASATHDRFARRQAEGLLTEADMLQARAELRSAEAMRVEVRRARDDARRQLGLILGWAADSVPVPADGLDDALDAETSVADQTAVPASRADVQARVSLAQAADARARAARASWFPRFEAFGGYTTHAADPFRSDAPEWTVGVGLSWELFDGFRRSATTQRARATARAARAELERAERAVVVEVRSATEGLESARSALEAATAAADAAAAGRDLMRRRFEEGLAGASDLLQAEARAVDMERRAVDVRADLLIAAARLRFALGRSATPERGEVIR